MSRPFNCPAPKIISQLTKCTNLCRYLNTLLMPFDSSRGILVTHLGFCSAHQNQIHRNLAVIDRLFCKSYPMLLILRVTKASSVRTRSRSFLHAVIAPPLLIENPRVRLGEQKGVHCSKCCTRWSDYQLCLTRKQSAT